MNKIEKIPVSQLCFDIRNPRLVEFGEITSRTTEKIVIKTLWDAMDVRELVMSIASSGFFEQEPLFVARENNRNVVIEGNRRLAAIKIILDPKLIQAEIPPVDDSIKRDILKLPVLKTTREKAWRIIGFKHVNGPAKWNSYAKARFIAQVHDTFNVPLDQIASQIGDTHKTVHQLYRGLMVAEQAEIEKIFSRDDTKRSFFDFSQLFTALQFRGVKEFIGLKEFEPGTKEFVPPGKVTQLEELFRWLYGSKKSDIEPVVHSHNPHLHQLDAILQNNEAIAALRDGENIENAFELTKPVSNVFESELLNAKRSLVKAKGLVTEGYDGSGSLMHIVKSISDIAYDLYLEMERKQTGGNGLKRIA